MLARPTVGQEHSAKSLLEGHLVSRYKPSMKHTPDPRGKQPPSYLCRILKTSQTSGASRTSGRLSALHLASLTPRQPYTSPALHLASLTTRYPYNSLPFPRTTSLAPTLLAPTLLAPTSLAPLHLPRYPYTTYLAPRSSTLSPC
ncbi:hypothetical protein PtA15_2A246 [Puccinia triticina]|uniref:Uncharacterized protein n=1 Tax=Puccinia triticina TaxID=208348 RepID=A0ABY7CAH5_9BASI|nr:uncharacterized protein PtA15_2A246 [Puccinia triticina]WAQ81933.1 hypothetical protein PtA15_2A246 [Puccinia triticina]